MQNRSQPLVSILIVTWNRKDDVLKAIASALGQHYANKEVVVLDNGSSDGTADEISKCFPQVVLVRSAVNLGCPSGRNLGFRHCRGGYIFLLDDDGWLDDAALGCLVEAVQAHPRIGVVMARIHEVADGRVARKLPVFAENRCYIAEFTGCCSLLRSDVLNEVGVFPEGFFRQGEETDLALRMFDAGYCVLVEPRAIMFHRPSPVGRSTSAFTFYMLRNTTRTAYRLWPAPWCFFKPIWNFIQALRFGALLRDPALPWRIWLCSIRDLSLYFIDRHPVGPKRFHRFRQLQRQPVDVFPI